MDTEAIKTTIAESAGIEHSVTPVHQVIVQRDLHEGRVGDDSPEP